MLSKIATTLLILSGTANCQNATQNTYQDTGIAICDTLLEAGFTDQLLLPFSSAYETSTSSYYNFNARLRPWCVLQPRSTLDVSRAMTALYNLTKYDDEVGGLAIRSGGHSSAFAASSIVNGVTMDLSFLNTTSYNISTGLASLGPGARWEHVYAALSPHNVTAVGGRNGGVGVGGFLLGGGISYYSAREGFGCDSVTNFEVVLANGTIVNANESSHSDLWKALKGGTNNFGVVTRFDVTTSPGQTLAYSERIIQASHSDAYVDALVRFISDNDEYPDDAIVGAYMHVPQSSEILILLIEVNTLGQANSTAFRQLNQIPANVSLDTHYTLAQAAKDSEFQGGASNVGASLTFKNDARIIRRGIQLHDEFVSSLTNHLGSGNFTSFCFFEPIPSSVEKFGQERGGNMLGLPQGEDLIIWDANVFLTTDDADLAIAHAALMNWTAQLKEYAKSVQGYVDLQYANYADASQEVVASYPMENQRFMDDVSQAYDPSQFFQRLVPGGFKLTI